jgi:hypothetical protein
VVQSNQLLGALEVASRKRIAPHLEQINLKLGAVVCDAGGLLKHAYFPQGSVLSLLTVLENGSAIEPANIGREGAFGLFACVLPPKAGMNWLKLDVPEVEILNAPPKGALQVKTLRADGVEVS